jgi:hypothetical protein
MNPLLPKMTDWIFYGYLFYDTNRSTLRGLVLCFYIFLQTGRLMGLGFVIFILYYKQVAPMGLNIVFFYLLLQTGRPYGA